MDEQLRAKNRIRGFFQKNPALRVGGIWAKWPGRHQDSETWSRKTASGSALDANGNALSDALGRSFTWSSENRLVQAVVPGQNGGTTTFKYDPFGRRIQKSGPLGTIYYLYDGANLVAEAGNSGNILESYAQGLRIDEPLSEFSASTVSYYQQDGPNSVSSLTNATGALTSTYGFDSFGQVTAHSGTLANSLEYTGRELDSETGMYFNRARYYDPQIGRFISEDPLGFAGGNLNVYSYVHNNPIYFLDPFGLQQCAWINGMPPASTCPNYHDGLQYPATGPFAPAEQSPSIALPHTTPRQSLINYNYLSYKACVKQAPKVCSKLPEIPDTPDTNIPSGGSGDAPGPADFGVTPNEGTVNVGNQDVDMTTTGTPLTAYRDCLAKFPLAVLDPRFGDEPVDQGDLP